MRKVIFAGDWVVEAHAVGVQRFALQILIQLEKMCASKECDFAIEVLVPENSTFGSNFKYISVVKKGTITSKLSKYYWQQVVFPSYVIANKGLGIDLTTALPILGCDIYALHDCIKEVFPEDFSSHKMHLFLYKLKTQLITHSPKKHIVTVSNYSKNEIKKYYKIPDSRISIVTNGWEHMSSICRDDSIYEKLGISNCDYFFAVGSKYKHKNYIWILNEAKINPKYKFVITGTGVFSNNESELENSIPENVIFTGYISDEEIKSLMINAKALLQPSFYEGFGIPPIEALSLGSKAIVANSSCLPEIYEDSVFYIDPNKCDYNLDSVLDGEVSSSEEILLKHSWHLAARQLISIIKNVMGQ